MEWRVPLWKGSGRGRGREEVGEGEKGRAEREGGGGKERGGEKEGEEEMEKVRGRSHQKGIENFRSTYPSPKEYWSTAFKIPWYNQDFSGIKALQPS